ncbi:ADAM family of metalloprotease ADM-B [Aspergillus chevalieri]|uniref:Disintegrin and metalloproteinase domain-containing protein B n=1 Tax=Aspergillus chevalieri TaxID=182096 RepID=A0A7R7VF28_ASPCH|nr:uncharacterized protein ACHE_10843S [Aspergillus chevalieri]BCR83441.1 hypothetical protein ACHE_10843S [Aspergillus chevalieri]
MRLFRNILPLVASVIPALFVGDVEARSQAPKAIKHVSSVLHPVIKTPSHQIDHLSNFDLTFSLHSGTQRIKLELEPNHDILADDAYVQYLDKEGNVHQEEPIKRHEHKVFKGRALVGTGQGRWNPVGWARIYMKRDGAKPLFEGVFRVHGDHHHIELASTYLEKKREDDVAISQRSEDFMIVYRDSDMVRHVQHSELKRSFGEAATCQADQLGFNTDPDHPVLRAYDYGEPSRWGAMSLNSMFGLSKRQSDIGSVSGNTGNVNLKTTIGDTSGCPNTKQVALIGIATDCTFTSGFSDNQTAREWIINTVNSASSVYESSFNISIGLRNLTVNEADCPTTAPESTKWNMPCDQGNVSSRLNLFSQWRGDNKDSNAYWTLMSGCPTGSEVGLSWLGQLCNSDASDQGSSIVSGTNIVVRTSGGGWQVFAHESGHTFGAVHDCDSSTCAQGYDSSSQCCPLSSSTCDADAKYIMNPSAQDVKHFSPCTIGNICSALGGNSVSSSCLSQNKGVTTITGSQCGNGIVEDGEDCDCGGEESCGSNNCCDAKTCKFKGDAVCDDANDGCCSDCQYSSADTVCRASRGECDIEEKCTGNSSSCPSDEYKDDGTSCGSGSGLTCASGQCTSRDQQCKSLMGKLLNSNDTWACDDSSCTVVCASDTTGPNSCSILEQNNFIDGTPCGGGGHCNNGKCEGTSVGGEIKSWVDKHKGVVIGICCAVGGLIVLAILSCLFNRCRRPRPKAMPVPPPGAWPAPPPRPSMGQWANGPNGAGYQGLANEPPPPYPGPYYGNSAPVGHARYA